MLVFLAVLLVRFAGQLGIFGFGSGGTGLASAGNCPIEGAPTVVEVDRDKLVDLREDLGQVVEFGGRILAYEQGPVDAGVAWSDAEPGWNPAPDPDSPLPGGYEMRWWMPSRDDVVADAFLFSDESQARDFLSRAASGKCRTAPSSRKASLFAHGRNLSWTNPSGFAEEDVFVQTGERVYRVAMVRAGAGPTIGPVGRDKAFAIVNSLACRLPGVECGADWIASDADSSLL